MPTTSTRMIMEDVQGYPDIRNIPIDRVGITGFAHPITFIDSGHAQTTIAEFTVSVALAHNIKGVHMSRIIEAVGEMSTHLDPGLLSSHLQGLRERMEAKEAHAIIEFPYFVKRSAPVTRSSAFVEYRCRIRSEVSSESVQMGFGVKVPVATVCPCSKAISEYGAHNQRGYADVNVQLQTAICDGSFSLVELISIVEGCGSAPVYSLLKRADERHVTMQAFDNPAFVEDVLRNITSHLSQDARIASFTVQVVNQESIHNHNVFAHFDSRGSSDHRTSLK